MNIDVENLKNCPIELKYFVLYLINSQMSIVRTT